MDRSRSYSRHRPVGNTANPPRSPSPSTPRDSTSSFTSRGRPISRPPPSHRGSRSRSTSGSSSPSPSRRQHHNHHHHPQRALGHEPSHHEHHHGGLLKTSAGLIAGIGLATVLAHKVWPKDEEDHESRSSSGSRSKHHHHHHHERHHEPHHRRASDASSNAERIVDRARNVHGHDVVYVEEAGPFRRGDARRMSLDQRPFDRLERQSITGRSSARPLPYPETPYPNEKFYEPRNMRASFSEAVPVTR